MLDLTKRLIAIPTENPPGNHYEECATTLFEELVRLRFDDVRREGACVLASVGTGPRILYFRVTTTLCRRKAAISFNRALKTGICSVGAHPT